jgi:PAS domain S-box-containing protein
MAKKKNNIETDPELFRDLINKSNDAIFVNDPQTGLFIFVNDNACASLGYDREELLKLGVMDIEATFSDHFSWQAHVNELRQSGSLISEVIHKRKNGTMIPVEVNVSFVVLNTREYMVAVVRDITERKQPEMVQQIMDTASVGIGLVDTRGRITHANRCMAEMFGCMMEELIGSEYADHVHPSERETSRRNMLALLASAIPSVDLERHYIRKDGTEFWGHLACRRFHDAQGNELGLIGVITDITERKLAEEALEKSEKMLLTIFDAEPECVKVLDEEANLIMMNRAGLDMIQVDSLDQVRGQCISPLITSEYRTAFMELTRRVFQGESGTLLFEMVGMKGRRLWLETRAVPLHNEKNEITALLGVTRDVTEHKRSEEELREKEGNYRLLFESANDGIFIQDESGFADCNQKGADMYGLTKKEIIGRSPSEFAPERQPDGRLSSEVADEKVRAALSGVPQVFEWQPVRADGSPFDVEVTMSRLELGGKMCLQAIVRDITERKRAEEEREKLQAQLYQSQKMESVGRLAGGVAHDFNNMLSAILGYTEMAMMECTPSETIHAYLMVIEQSALRSAALVRQLLAFARKQTVAPKVLDLNDTVAGLLKMLQRLMGEDIDFAWMPGACLWPVQIDPSQIDQLLANLFVNARDAIAEVGKITIETENAFFDEGYCAVHPGFVPGEYVMLAVSDNGCGMSKEVIDHLFEPFFTTKEAGKGTGLGLATVYGIVKQNEGVINVYSEPDKGSTFKIFLPRFVGEAIEPMAVNTTETPKGRGETVLLVEDEASILNMSQKMLEALGYRVLTASTPGEAVRQVKAHASEIQLLITDVVMPEMNGLDLARLLSEINPGLKCLFSSGYTANVIAHRGILDKGMHFLQKPFCMKDLATKVREALERESPTSNG